MIDVHSHVIPFVDDGSKNTEISLSMLETIGKCGVTDVICTPHYRRSMFEAPKEIIIDNFEKLKAANKTGVRLHLGQEIAYDPQVFTKLERGELLTYCGSEYVLLEFSYTRYIDISNVVFECKLRGYKPVIAHIERYEYIGVDDVEEIRSGGALIQVNADSLFFGSPYHGVSSKYLRRDLVDIIANDFHSNRKYLMDKAYNKVKRKYGEERSNRLFVENPELLIKND